MKINFLIETTEALEHKDYVKAFKNSQEILKENPDDLEALKILAKCSMEFGRIPAWSTTLMCTEKILNQKPDDFDAKILRIKALLKLGKDVEASLLLDRVEKTEPDNPIVLQIKSSVLLDNGENNAAQKYLDRLLEMKPEMAYNNLGLIAWNSKLREKALSFFTNRLSSKPSDFSAALNKCWILYELKKYDDAISTVKDFIDHFGDVQYQMKRELPILYLSIARDFNSEVSCEFNHQPTRLGETILEKSDKRWNDPKFKNTRARTEFLKKSHESFKIIDEENIHNQRTKYWKAVMYCTIGDINFAMKAIDECLLEEQCWNMLSWKAYALKRQGKYKDAIEVADQVLKDDPEDPIAWAAKVDALYWSGDLLEYKRLVLKNEEKQRKNKKLSNQIKSPEEISIFPGEDFDNIQKFIEVLSCCKKNIWWVDPYFGIKAFQYIRQALYEKNDISEIHALTSCKKIGNKSLSLDQRIDKLNDYRGHVRKFNKQYSEIDMTLGINENLLGTESPEAAGYHDRYLISQNNEWNIPSLDSVSDGDRSDIMQIKEQKTIAKDLKYFEDLWNNELTFKITGRDDDYNKVKQILENICDICHKAFSSGEDMKNHMKEHAV